MPLIIGITGSIAAGKSIACEAITALGATHCDADRLVHRLYDPGKPAFDRIVAAFGNEVVGEDGFVDRKVLGSKVFGNPVEMSRLTTAIGDIAKAIKDVVDEWNVSLGAEDVALLEAVNLIEGGYGRWCNQVWLLACEDEVARARLMERNQMSEDDANQRLASQRKWQDREPAADLVLVNDSGIDEFRIKVEGEFTSARDLWLSGKLPPSRYYQWWESRNAG
ncbi:MAG: dephospho-CoA kinase [SAR202 cluster bacterium Casp-Chloro-G4]|nr:dephospho-CoA kinase [Chloroflexota bacterium]MDA1227877.1 dephospho-CoA kinase [Chloroflexota bacterium]PKB61485.1 MAG: dephospho-CoA kinase [SAR202 cluster bacterium Casp-Chloro-G4]